MRFPSVPAALLAPGHQEAQAFTWGLEARGSRRGAPPLWLRFPPGPWGRHRPGRDGDANSCLPGPTWSSQPCPLRGLWTQDIAARLARSQVRLERRAELLPPPRPAGTTWRRDCTCPGPCSAKGNRRPSTGPSHWPGPAGRPAELRKFRAAHGPGAGLVCVPSSRPHPRNLCSPSSACRNDGLSGFKRDTVGSTAENPNALFYKCT